MLLKKMVTPIILFNSVTVLSNACGTIMDRSCLYYSCITHIDLFRNCMNVVLYKPQLAVKIKVSQLASKHSLCQIRFKRLAQIDNFYESG